MVAAIDLILEWIDQAGGTDMAVLRDPLVRSAIERQMLVISEAPIRLDKLDPAVAPGFAPDIDWPGIRGIGNFIRHKYDNIDVSILLDVISNRLASLRAAAIRAIM